MCDFLLHDLIVEVSFTYCLLYSILAAKTLQYVNCMENMRVHFNS